MFYLSHGDRQWSEETEDFKEKDKQFSRESNLLVVYIRTLISRSVCCSCKAVPTLSRSGPNRTNTINPDSEGDFATESEALNTESEEFKNESESDAVIISEGLRETGFDINIAEAQEWLTVNMHEQGHSTMTDEEIQNFVSNPVAEDNDEADDTTDEPIIPSHSEAFESFIIVYYG